MSMSSKLAFVGAYVLVLAAIVLKHGVDSGNFVLVAVGLLSLVVPVVIFRIRCQIRRVRR